MRIGAPSLIARKGATHSSVTPSTSRSEYRRMYSSMNASTVSGILGTLALLGLEINTVRSRDIRAWRTSRPASRLRSFRAVTEPLIDTTASRYRVGQKWHYRTRPGEESSYLTVLKVEDSGTLGVVVHVRIEGLRIENPHHPAGVSDTIGHMPMAEAALDESVTVLDSDSLPLADEDDGYQEWRSAFDAGEAGIWSVTVAQAVDHIAQAIGGAEAS